jgi:acetate kinase
VNLLTVNTGSSSIRLACFTSKNYTLEKIAHVHYQAGEKPAEAILNSFITEHKIQHIFAVAHRIVHGGTQLAVSCIIDSNVEKEIERLSPLAPLHNPIALKWVRICQSTLNHNVPQVAVFDTAFFSALPQIASIYPIPGKLAQQHEIRRYGFHGIAHQAMYQHWREQHPEFEDGGRVITLQLGAGCSIGHSLR